MKPNIVQIGLAGVAMLGMFVLAFWMLQPSSTGPDPLPSRRERRQVKVKPAAHKRWKPGPVHPRPMPKVERIQPQPQPAELTPEERLTKVRCATFQAGLDASLVFAREVDRSNLDEVGPLVAIQYGRSALGLASSVLQWETFDCEEIPDRNEIADILSSALTLEAELSPEQEDQIREALKVI